MPQPIVDPINTKVVQGYKVPENVGYELFPAVPVYKTGGKVIMFTDRDFKLYNSTRAPGSNTKRIDIGYEGDSYAVENHSLEGKVPREHLRDTAAEAPTINLGMRATKKVMRALHLELEVQQATIARDESKYPATNKITLSGTSKWTDPTSDPIGDMETGKEAVRQQCGTEPNKLVLSPAAFKALKNHPAILKRLTITADGKAVTAAMLAELFDIEKVVVGKAVMYDGATNTTADVWGEDAVLGYVPDGEQADRENPSFGYTYEMDGHPYVEASYYDNNAKTWFYPVTHERVPVIAGITAGYLFKNTA